MLIPSRFNLWNLGKLRNLIKFKKFIKSVNGETKKLVTTTGDELAQVIIIMVPKKFDYLGFGILATNVKNNITTSIGVFQFQMYWWVPFYLNWFSPIVFSIIQSLKTSYKTGNAPILLIKCTFNFTFIIFIMSFSGSTAVAPITSVWKTRGKLGFIQFYNWHIKLSFLSKWNKYCM